MTATVSSNCESITISSDILAEFSSYTSVTLKWNYNTTNGEYTEYEVQSTDITSSSMTLSPEFFSFTDSTLPDGIYCFRLEGIASTSVVEYASAFVYCSLKCKLATNLYNYPEKMLHAAFEAIKLQTECDNCNCTTAVTLYNDLLCQLDSSDKTNCGC